MTESNQDGPRLRHGADPEEEALRWIARLTSGEASEQERLAFDAWRADPMHAALYAELEDIWADLGTALVPPDNVVPLRPRKPRLQVWNGRVAAAAAACLALVVAGSYQYATVWQYDHVAQGAARSHVALADGSSVELNTGAALNIDYAGKLRRVTLARGEAYFDVRHDPSRPFIVKAGSGEVRVLGTAFSVAREGDGARVTVTRGKVRVSSGDHYVDITPDQQVAFAGGSEGQVLKVDAGKLLAWSRGRLIFENAALSDVIASIDRYYPGMILLTNREVGAHRVSAVIDLDRIDNWLTSLKKSQHVRATYLPGLTILR